ncbi:glycogen synthase GlgA [Providencia rustigianii]|uniref:glycogen synthase GlgA n=1 Tax=Providencia rustigianii TaxID=158850 RepID=UPI000D846FBE|nr:glycogen synthase GlgA [Providencia rustigianii]SPY78983.1 Glycogen synthase [Providencia rustigianii]
MRILHACSELFPLLKTGGLADVLGALPQAQIAEGADVRLVLPGFPALLDAIQHTLVGQVFDTFAGQVALRFGTCDGVGIYLIDAPHLYQRAGSPYHNDELHDYADNYLRFALLGWIASELACGLDPQWRAEIVHAHDWHAGLTAAYLAARGYPAPCVFTVHNLAYQGLFSPKHFSVLQLPRAFFSPEGLEFYGQISYLKAGLFYANKITFVSPTYAKEVTTPEYGNGLADLLKQRQSQHRLVGILNGVDYQIWEPQIDPLIPHNYARQNMLGKGICKMTHQRESGLSVTDKVPLFVVISRLSTQKGLDLLLEVVPELLRQGGQLSVLGSGDHDLQAAFELLALHHPKQVSVVIGYDEPHAHKLIAAADVIVVPSRYEPCGLTQLYGLKYGALPLVRHTGGLADTVCDCSLENLADRSATGFVFHDYHGYRSQHGKTTELNDAVRRVFALWNEPTRWKRVRRQGMKIDFSWQISAKKYLDLYQNLL